MQIKEIMETASLGATVSGNFATVSQPLVNQSRQGGSLLTGKYTTELTPNTPENFGRISHARRQFKNSPGN